MRRTLEKKRELRFQSVDEVKTQVDAAKDAKPSIAPEAAGAFTVPRRKTARYAMASAVCTGIRLVLGPFFPWRFGLGVSQCRARVQRWLHRQDFPSFS